MTILLHRRKSRLGGTMRVESRHVIAHQFLVPTQIYANRPPRWLAIKSQNVIAVQRALGLHNPKPCPWQQGLSGEEKLFIAPPINGWIVVVGSDLPDPGEDPDACFHFVTRLSRKLAQVQLFSANRVLYDHAWVRAE